MKYEYDLVIIGGGSAGLIAAQTGSYFGKKIAIIDKIKLGGASLWNGCIPSKALLHAAALANKQNLSPKDAYTFAKKEIKRATDTIANEHDNPEYFKQLGVDSFFGTARFVDSHTVSVDDKKITAKSFLIATGSRPSLPELPGLETIPYATNETIFSLETLPESIIVLGGGPIGCELAQAFVKLGANVTLIQHGSRLLPKDEREVAEDLKKILEQDGVTIHCDTTTESVSLTKGRINLQVTMGETKKLLIADALLIATGRTTNVENLGLESIGIVLGKKGIEHNELLQTTVPHIYVAGDVSGDYQFTHFASAQASCAVRNIFLPFKKSFNPQFVPWVTFTKPEIAHIGYTEDELKEKQIPCRIIHLPYFEVDRAVSEGHTEGFIKIMIDAQNLILGAQIMGERAGELIHECILAIEFKLSVDQLISVIHAYPTYSSGIQQALFKDYIQTNTPQRRRARFLSKFT